MIDKSVSDDDKEIINISADLISSTELEKESDDCEESDNAPITPDHFNFWKLSCDSKTKSHKTHSHKKKKKKKKRKKSYALIPGYSLHEFLPRFTHESFAEGYVTRQGQNIPSSMKFNLNHTSFFMFGKTGNGEYVGKAFDCDGHIAIFGGSGSGKSTGIAIPTLHTWKGSIFSFDFKGDLVKWVEKRRYSKILYLLSNQKNQFWYDPFYIIHLEGFEHLIQNARELAYAIIPLPVNIVEPFWIEAARNVLTGAIVYFYKLGLDFIDTMIKIKTTPMESLIKTITTDETSAVCVNPDLILSPKLLAGISMELHNYISVFATDTLIQDALSPSDDDTRKRISWQDLERTDVFVRIEQTKVEQWSGVIRLLLVQLLHVLGKRPEKYEEDGKRIAPTLLMLDEFPQYGKIDVFTSALKILRSKNVTISIFCQSLADLDEAYGKVTRCTILDNCPYKAILNASDVETQHYFSDLAGTIKTPTKGINANFDTFGHQAGYSATINESREPIIYPHEFASLTDIILLHPYPERFCRLRKETFFRQAPSIRLIEERNKKL